MNVAPRNSRDLVAAVEARPVLRGKNHERFLGYAVLGVRFASGDVLALRRFAASSVGPGYTSVWHRDPHGSWVVYQTVPVHAGCGRYFSEGVDRVTERDIRIAWTGADAFVVSVLGGEGLEWELSLATTAATRLISTAARATAFAVSGSTLVARVAGSLAGRALGAGPLSLSGETPNGFRFAASATDLRLVKASRAVIGARATGSAVVAGTDITLGGVRIPDRGLFALATAVLQGPAGRVAGSQPA